MGEVLVDLRRRRRAALGSAAFMVAGPGVVTGLVPWLLSRWNVHRPVPGGTRHRSLRPGIWSSAGSTVTCATRCMWRWKR